MKKILAFSSVLAIVAGVILVAGGIWGISFTYKNVAREKIVTGPDTSIPNTPVRGPLTLMSQADIIREHTLKSTGGKVYAEMPREIPKLDVRGNPELDERGQPVMTANTARDIWVTATTLTTTLQLGIITYIFSGFVVLIGIISIWTGVVFYLFKKRTVPTTN